MSEFGINPIYNGEIECVIVKGINPRKCCEEQIVAGNQFTPLDELLDRRSRLTNNFCPIGKFTGISEEAYKKIEKGVTEINESIEKSETKKRELPDILIK